MRFLVAFLFLGVLFNQLHWTQRIENATVLQMGSCQDLSGATFSDGWCTYSKVTIEGSLISQSYELTDQRGTTVSIKPESRRSVGWIQEDQEAGTFTWRTWLLIMGWLLLTIALAVPDVRRVYLKRRAERGEEPGHGDVPPPSP